MYFYRNFTSNRCSRKEDVYLTSIGRIKSLIKFVFNNSVTQRVKILRWGKRNLNYLLETNSTPKLLLLSGIFQTPHFDESLKGVS